LQRSPEEDKPLALYGFCKKLTGLKGILELCGATNHWKITSWYRLYSQTMRKQTLPLLRVYQANHSDAYIIFTYIIIVTRNMSYLDLTSKMVFCKLIVTLLDGVR